jgi:molybdopterin-containing oxidoreductase family iron-sulfur binding subunit
MNRLYAVESTPTSTGAVADHRLSVRGSDIENFARAVAKGVGLDVESADSTPHADWVAAIVRDLMEHRGSSLVTVGDCQPPSLHALAHAMNVTLGNAGTVVVYADSAEFNPVDQIQSLVELVEDMERGEVDVLAILGGNPAYTAPADLQFAGNLSKVGLSIHLSLYQDETSHLCDWHLPSSHYLESWSDVRAFDGTATIIQPLIAPLYGGKSELEVLSVLMGNTEVSGYSTVREYWRSSSPSADFEEFWEVSLHDGFIADSSFLPRALQLRTDWDRGRIPNPPATGLEIAFRPDPCIFDGRFANNGWLQELPKPLTKLTWDNAVLVSPATAERINIGSQETVEILFRGRTVHAPVWIVPGLPQDSATVHLGYGRTRAGRVGTGVGFNAYALRTLDMPWFGTGAELRKLGGDQLLACTQDHFRIEGRDLIRGGTAAEYGEDPQFLSETEGGHAEDISLYPEWKYEGYKWGMNINLGSCTGCNACVVACEAENNGAVVGRDQVANGREMHWLRIDRYYKGDLDNPSIHFQPVLCMHCENAPCEVVCPVAATSHSAEGLNQMIYNRCVGTRYCSNNCPYKVRRFNFFQYVDWESQNLKLLRNPDVTVRSRGVMEKCTFCVQRINKAKIEAEKADRKLRDGEIVTACQAACPTQAITFGDLNDSGSIVAKLRKSPLGYGLLAELNVRPRTTYLARITNPNPQLEKD